MTDINELVAANRAAVSELIAAAERPGLVWTAPRAPGKWSPSQVVEHVARALEESANVVSGAPSQFPTIPPLLRPLLRVLFFNRILRKSSFPTARTNPALDPTSGPSTPAQARPRLEEAVTKFTDECLAQAARGQQISSTIFGTIAVTDYARFQELHTRHHCRQMPGAP